MSNTIVSNFGNYNPIDPAVIAYVNAAIATANADAVQASPPSIANAIAQYADTTGKLIKSTPYTMPDTLGVAGQVLEVGVGGNIVYGAGGGVPPTYLPTLTVTNLSQGPNALSTNYTLPEYPPPIDTILGNNGVQGFIVEIPTNINSGFLITASNPLRFINFNVPIPAGTYIPDDLTNLLSVGIRDTLNANNVIANIFVGFDPTLQRYGLRLSPGTVDFTNLFWNAYVNGVNNNDVFGLTTGSINITPAAPGVTYCPDAPLYLNATGELIWRSVAKNIIESDNGNSVIECSELSGIISYGDYNINNGSLNNIGNINALDNCNITTNTTQIENGLGELNISINSLPRITQDAIKTKIECGTSALNLAALSDGLTPNTTTYLSSSNIGNTANISAVVLPDSYNVYQNNGAIQRLIVDDTKSAIYSKNALSGPTGSSLTLNNDSSFSLSSYFAGTGAVECSANSMAIIGPQAKSAVVLTDATITKSLFNGSLTVVRETMDSMGQTFKDGNQVERIKLDSSDVTINGAYTLPTTAGVDGEVLTRTTGIATTWSRPQVFGLYSQIAVQTVANTTTETTLISPVGIGSLTVPPLFFQNGQSFLYKTGGTFRDSSNGQTIRFRLRNGGVLFDSGILSLSNVNTVRGWNIEAQFTYYGGNMITNFQFSYTDGNNDSFGFNNQGTNAINNAVSNTLNFTVQWGAANANNTISSNYGTLTKIF